jgi:hypothetical protein
MIAAERQSLINQYKAGYDEVIQSLEDFPVDGFTAHPIAGKWSACEIVHHLADSESYSVEDWLRIYAAHAHNHAAQIRRLRDALQS